MTPSISDFSENLIKTDSDFVEEKKSEPEATEAPKESTSVDVGPVSPKPSGITLTGTAPSTTPPSLVVPVKESQTTEQILQGVLDKMGDIGASSNLKIMIFGDPGSMKSSFTATAPNNFVADLEDGLMAAKNSPHGIAENVKAYPWGGFEDFTNVVRAFIENPPELDWVDVVTIDTFSELHKRGLAEITEREWRKRPSTNRYVPETEHHMENNERMIRLVRALRDLNRDLIIVTHAKTVEPKTGPSKTYADFSESLSNKVMAMMDVVGYMSKRVIDGKVTPVMQVVGDGTIHCKTRIPLPNEIIDPTYDKIKSAWEEMKNK